MFLIFMEHYLVPGSFQASFQGNFLSSDLTPSRHKDKIEDMD